MGFVTCSKSIQKSISCSGGISGISFGKSLENSQTMWTNLLEEFRILNLTIWYKHPLLIILQAFNQEMI